jgi:hypothetical protein
MAATKRRLTLNPSQAKQPSGKGEGYGTVILGMSVLLERDLISKIWPATSSEEETVKWYMKRSTALFDKPIEERV